MRNKKAKALRRSLGLCGVDVDERVYREINIKTKLITDPVTGMTKGTYNTSTIVLTGDCGRKLYKRAKI